MVSKFIPRQDPIKIYQERIERMKLVSIAPLIFLIGLFLINAIVLYLKQKEQSHFTAISNGLLIAVSWFIIIGYLIRRKIIKKILGNISTIFRFLFDLPILLICLIWVIYCFYTVNVFQYPFFITFYALSVYSAAKMVSIPVYAVATNLIGILLILFFPILISKYIVTEKYFSLSDILENFAGLYIGLYFIEIQTVFIKIINYIIQLIKHITSVLLEDPLESNETINK